MQGLQISPGILYWLEAHDVQTAKVVSFEITIVSIIVKTILIKRI